MANKKIVYFILKLIINQVLHEKETSFSIKELPVSVQTNYLWLEANVNFAAMTKKYIIAVKWTVLKGRPTIFLEKI